MSRRPSRTEAEAEQKADVDKVRYLPERFETKAQVRAEDRLRARRMKRVLNGSRRANSNNLADQQWLAKQNASDTPAPQLDRGAVRALRKRLVRRVARGKGPRSLASSMRMRTIRRAFLRALQRALAGYEDIELRTVTVIHESWNLGPDELDRVTAAQLKAQLRTHLDRAGVTAVPGPLIAVLHGEFEPTTGRYVLHFHLVTTAAKAALMGRALRRSARSGYRVTATGASPIRISTIGDRVRQLSYLVKSFWPSRPITNGKRVRDPQRIPEPFGTQVLLWLDRQPFSDLVLMNRCWSRRNGGSAAMRELFFKCRAA